MTNNMRNAINRLNQSIDEWIVSSQPGREREVWVQYELVFINVRLRELDTAKCNLTIKDISFLRSELESLINPADFVFSRMNAAIALFKERNESEPIKQDQKQDGAKAAGSGKFSSAEDEDAVAGGI